MRHRLDTDAMARIQGDITSMSADRILKHVEVPAEVQELSAWDRRIDARPAAALYEAFEEALWRRTFADEMPSSLYDRFYRYAGNERFAGLHAIITDAESPWFDDRGTRDVIERRGDIARQAAADAMSSLRDRFGDRSNWRWNEMHAVKFSHPLSGGGRAARLVLQPRPGAGRGRQHDRQQDNDESEAALRNFRSRVI